MPKLIDYVGRFEFIRMAAFAVVLDDGVDALSRRRVDAELGTGVNTIRRSVAGWADLARLAADHVVSRRLLGRLGRYTEDPVEKATHLVRAMLPEDPSHLDEEGRLAQAHGDVRDEGERPGAAGTRATTVPDRPAGLRRRRLVRRCLRVGQS
jgi:hypothetical protein